MNLGCVKLQLRAIQDKDHLIGSGIFFFFLKKKKKITKPPLSHVSCGGGGWAVCALACMYTALDNLGCYSLPHTLLEKNISFPVAYTRMAAT